MSHDVLNMKLIWVYSSPRIVFGIMYMLFTTYLLKFATDELLIAPAIMGSLIAISRLWDGVSDPLIGYLSDRTTAKLGRRRSWMFFSIIPMAIGLVMVWSPPPFLTGLLLVFWMGIALIMYETASTAFIVPHNALGVELTHEHDARTRLYGSLHMIGAIGSILGLAALQVITTTDEKRFFAFIISTVAAVFIVLTLFWSTSKLPEKRSSQGRGGTTIYRSFSDVLKNKYARFLIIFFAIETFGVASVGLLTPYVATYVVDLETQLVLLLVVYSVPQFAFTPLWIWLAKRVSRKKLWMAAMWLNAITFVSWFFVLQPGEPSILIWILAFLLGTAAGVGAVMAPSIQADVIDFDELLTYERKEGTYLAVWNLTRKTAASIAAFGSGLGLQLAGFESNVEQSENTQFVLRSLIALLPAGCYVCGAILFLKFDFDREKHSETLRSISSR